MKRILISVTVIWNLATALANAYYNPSTGRWLGRDPANEKGGLNLFAFCRENSINEVDALGQCSIKLRCGPVIKGGITVGWHCGVIAPNGVEYGIGGGGNSSGSAGPPTPYPTDPHPVPGPIKPPPPQVDYPVSCGKCASCDSIQTCIQTYHNNATPPLYNPLGPNSNTYAHSMLNACGCGVDPIPLPCIDYFVNGVKITACPDPTTTPPGAVAWDYGF